jgi:hypothetical protein
VADQEQTVGYVRCGVIHAGAELSFEVLSEEPKIALLLVATEDGDVQCALNRASAERLAETLRLFLADWPEGQVGT